MKILKVRFKNVIIFVTVTAFMSLLAEGVSYPDTREQVQQRLEKGSNTMKPGYLRLDEWKTEGVNAKVVRDKNDLEGALKSQIAPREETEAELKKKDSAKESTTTKTYEEIIPVEREETVEVPNPVIAEIGVQNSTYTPEGEVEHTEFLNGKILAETRNGTRYIHVSKDASRYAIQDLRYAIKKAKSGDVIFIHKGTYGKIGIAYTVSRKDNIKIIGENPYNTVLRGGSLVFGFYNCSGITVTNLTFRSNLGGKFFKPGGKPLHRPRGSRTVGTGVVSVNGSHEVTIENNIIADYYMGIRVDYYSSEIAIRNNDITDCGDGIVIQRSSSVTIEKNNITGSRFTNTSWRSRTMRYTSGSGIQIDRGVSDVRIIQNAIYDNEGVGILIRKDAADGISECSDNYIYDNKNIEDYEDSNVVEREHLSYSTNEGSAASDLEYTSTAPEDITITIPTIDYEAVTTYESISASIYNKKPQSADLFGEENEKKMTPPFLGPSLKTDLSPTFGGLKADLTANTLKTELGQGVLKKHGLKDILRRALRGSALDRYRELRLSRKVIDSILVRVVNQPTKEEENLIERVEKLKKDLEETGVPGLSKAFDEFVRVVADILFAQAVPNLLPEQGMKDIKTLFGEFEKKKNEIFELYKRDVAPYYKNMKEELIKNRAILEIRGIVPPDTKESEIAALGRKGVAVIIEKLRETKPKTEKEKFLFKREARLRARYLNPALKRFEERMRYLLESYTRQLTLILESKK